MPKRHWKSPKIELGSGKRNYRLDYKYSRYTFATATQDTTVRENYYRKMEGGFSIQKVYTS